MEEIKVPKGWKITQQDDDKIVIERAGKAKTWQEINNANGDKRTYGFNVHAQIFESRKQFDISVPDYRTAERIIALCKLFTIAEYYNRVYADNWEPVFGIKGNKKYELLYDDLLEWIIINNSNNHKSGLPLFATKELAIMALENNREICEKALMP